MGNQSNFEHRKQKSLAGTIFFKFFRWFLIAGFFCFVLRGWIWSFDKYTSGQTSISQTKNETRRYRYPSITFCPMFINKVKINQHILPQYKKWSCENKCGIEDPNNCKCQPNCTWWCCKDLDTLCTNTSTPSMPKSDPNEDLADIDLPWYLEHWSHPRTKFLTLFSHPEHGNPRNGTHVLKDDKYWTVSYPHNHLSGKCYTYDPPYDSQPGWWHGIRFGIKFHGDERLTPEKKQKAVKDMLHMYIHEKGKFAFYMQDDFPSSHKIDTSWLKYNQENSIDLEYKTYTALTSKDRPCTDDPSYDFNKCLELKYSERRGCQPPWNSYNDSDIPLCRNVTELKIMFDPGDFVQQKDDKVFQSPLELAFDTGCPLPCTTTKIIPNYSYKNTDEFWTYFKGIDRKAEWVVQMWFKNFHFSYEREYVVCNWTCLIGEIGGNLGFFLGGSILAFIDIVLRPLRHRFLI